MIEFVIVSLLVAYSSWVIYKKVKQMKNGNHCGCGCSDCPAKKQCHK